MAGSNFSLGEAVLQTRVSLEGLQQGISQAESISRSGMQGAANAGLGIFQTAFAVSLGSLIAQGLSAIASSIHGVFSTMIGEAAEAQRGQAQLAAVIQSTGGVAGVTAQKANELASAIQRTTPISDDAVIAGEHMLLTFTNIGAKIFPDATKAMVDMATSMNNGMTPSSEQLSKQAIMLGKALNDPIAGASALRKVGVTLSEQQQESIKHFMAVGDIASAQGVILQELQKEFGGAAEAAGKTFSGSLDMLRNKFLEVAENAGGRLLPSLQNLNETLMRPEVEAAVTSLANALADVLAGAIDFLANTVIPGLIAAWEFIAPAVEGGLQIFRDIASEVFAWGENIGMQFGAGIQAAISYVVDAINSIGSVITSLLQPGSPPRLLPDLDTWGTGAVNAYMSGWNKGDFSVFNDLSSAIQSHIESIAKALGDKHIDMATIMIGEQGALANAINEIDTIGEVSEEAFQKVIDAAGPAGRDITGLVRSYLDLRRATNEVERAQVELNQVTQEYSEKLAPLQANLKAIQDRKQELQDTQRLADLQETLADSTKSATEKAIAQAEIDEINAKRQIRSVEDERDAAVDAAKAKVAAAKQTEAAAKAQADQQKQLLDVNNKQNALIAEQTKAMDSAAKSMHAAAGAVSAHAAQQNQLGQTVGRVADTVNIATQRVGEVTGAVQRAIAPFTEFIGRITAAFSSGDLLTNIGNFRERILQGITNILPDFLAITEKFAMAGGQWVLDALPRLLDNLATLGERMIDQTMTYVPQWVAMFAKFGLEMTEWAVAALPDLLSNLGRVLTGIIDWVLDSLPRWGAELGKLAMQLQQWVVDALPGLGTNLGKALGVIINWIIQTTIDVVPKLLALGLKFLSWVATDVLPSLPGVLAAIATFIYNFITGVVGETGPKIAVLAQRFYLWVTETVIPNLPGQLATIGAAINTWVGTATTDAALWLLALAAKFYTWVADTVIPAIPGELAKVETAIGDWVNGAVTTVTNLVIGIGTAVVDGIRQGISDAWDSFLSWLHDKIMQIPGPVRDALGISSPSQVFAEIGRAIIEGLILGMQQLLPDLDNEALAGIAEALGKMFELINSAVGAFTSLSGWAGISMQAVADFIAVTNYLMASITQIALAYKTKLTDAASDFARAAGDILQLIGDGAEALGRLNDLGTVSQASVDQFIATMLLVLNQMSSMVDAFGFQFLDNAQFLAATIGTVLDMLDKGMDGLNSLADIVDTPQQSIDIFGSDISRLLTAMAAIAGQFEDEALLAAGTFTDAAGQVLALVGSGVESLTALASFRGTSVTAANAFLEVIRLIITGIVRAAETVSAEGLASAAAFSDAAGQVVTMIDASLDVLADLATFSYVAYGRIDSFSVTIFLVVRLIANVADMLGREATAAAVSFASAIGRVFETIRTALDVLARLATFAAPTVTAISLFAMALDNVIAQLARMAISFDTDALRAAQLFARAVGDVIGLISTAVDALLKLQDFRAIPGAAVYAFATALDLAIYYLAQLARSWDTDAVEAAAAFAEAAGKVVGVIATGVDGFIKLIGFRGVPAVALTAFGAALRQAITLIGTMASQWSTEAIARASEFADSVSSVVGLIGAGAQAFTDLAELGPVAPTAFQAFASSMSQTLQMMVVLAAQWSIGAIDQATAFANAVGAIINLVKTAVDTFSALQDFSDNAPSILSTFIATVNALLAQFIAAVIPPATNLGRSIMQAIASAITANTSLIVNALTGALDAAFAAAEVYFQNAPSLEGFANAAGESLARATAQSAQRYGGMMGPVLAGVSGSAFNSVVNDITNFNLTAQYRHQPEQSLRDDVVLLSMLKGGRRK